MKIGDHYIGSLKGHIITFILMFWTLGIGNLIYAGVANRLEDKPASYRWGAMFGAVLIFMVLGSMLPSAPVTTTPVKETPVKETPTAPAAPAAPAPAPAAPAPAEITYQVVTIAQLNSGSIPVGTNVEASGIVMQNMGDGGYLIRNSNYQLVFVVSSQNVYEGSELKVKGIYGGPTTYTTTMGASKTVPYVKEV